MALLIMLNNKTIKYSSIAKWVKVEISIPVVLNLPNTEIVTHVVVIPNIKLFCCYYISVI